MAKLDIATQTHGIDKFLATLDNPLHRQIIENYRRHAILEGTGQNALIFTPEMTVEHPIYYLNMGGTSITLEGQEQVMAFYAYIEERKATIMIAEDEKLAVSDWGFASEAMFSSFMPGSSVPATLGPVDPDKLYIVRQRVAMVWDFDERARMIGEHVYEHGDSAVIVECPPADYVTVEDAKEKLLPLLRPLPEFPARANSRG